MLTQDEANKILGKWDDRVAGALGVTDFSRLHVVVEPAAQFEREHPGATSWANGDGTITIPDSLSGQEAIRHIAYEAAHALIMGSNPGASTALGENGLTGGAAGKASEALAGVVAYNLGLQPDDWQPDGRQTKLLALSGDQLKSVATAISSGTFTTIKAAADFPTARNPNTQGAPAGGTGGAGDVTYPVGAWTFTLHTDGTVSAGPTGGQMTDYASATEASAAYAAAPIPPSQLQVNNAVAAFQSVAQGLGLAPDSVAALIQHAAEKGWSTARFNQALMTTPAFHDAFPGIFDPNGSLRMSPTQYLATQRSYQATASQYGINLNPKTEAWLFQNEVSPSEFAQRAPAVQKLQSNQQYFAAFNQTLKSMGQAPLSRGDQLRFAMGEGNKEWYDIAQNASTRYEAEQAGLKVGRVGAAYTNIGEGLLAKIAGKGLTEEQMSAGFQEVGQNLLTALPAAKKDSYGLTKGLVAQASFGGPGQARARQLIQHVLAQESAFFEDRGRAALQSGPQGGIQTPGRLSQAQSD